MNILFLSLLDINTADEDNIYMDLLNEFIAGNHNIYIASPSERRKKEKTHLIDDDKCKILKIKTGNIQKTNILEKGISTILIEKQFKNAIKEYFCNVKFDLILYATPPITLYKTILYIKKRDNAKTYLMLKDIFPQNAVDLNLFTKKSLIYKYFRNKEKKLYSISDKIGCMSDKNVEYLLQNNSFINNNKVEVLPNSIRINEKNLFNLEYRKQYRYKYNIPDTATVFIYGGNLGKPQGVDFIVKCLYKFINEENCYFIICGSGTEYYKLENFIKQENPTNIILTKEMSKQEYNDFLNIGDIGLIFLDYRFTIPNFPSRILSYMEKEIPVLACTDQNTDIGDIIQNNGFGWKCLSNNVNDFYIVVKEILKLKKNILHLKGNSALQYLKMNYDSKKGAQRIIDFINNKRYEEEK